MLRASYSFFWHWPIVDIDHLAQEVARIGIRPVHGWIQDRRALLSAVLAIGSLSFEQGNLQTGSSLYEYA